MVSTMTSKFPTEHCTMMLSQYDQVLADLKRREESNKPLSAEKIKALTAAGAPSFGSKSAKVTLIEFSDFECPYCSKAAETVSQIKKKYGDKVHFIFRQFPLGFHKNAQVAAEASLAANAQGKFWPYHDMLFQNQKKLDRESLDGYAKKLGLDMAKFKKALDSKTYEAAVKSDLKLGELAAVSGTPSLFLNGERVANPTDFNAIDKMIGEKLAN
jgi:protein-disulfide isomerase